MSEQDKTRTRQVPRPLKIVPGTDMRPSSKHFETIYVTKPVYANGIDDTTTPEKPTMRCSKTNTCKTEERLSASL